MENLWGELPQFDSIRLPATILKEQAQVITDLTQGLLQGTVASDPGRNNSLFTNLILVVPTLNNYKYTVLYTLTEPPLIYPLKLRSLVHDVSFDVESEVKFLQILKDILSSHETKMLILSLVAQARGF